MKNCIVCALVVPAGACTGAFLVRALTHALTHFAWLLGIIVPGHPAWVRSDPRWRSGAHKRESQQIESLARPSTEGRVLYMCVPRAADVPVWQRKA